MRHDAPLMRHDALLLFSSWRWLAGPHSGPAGPKMYMHVCMSIRAHQGTSRCISCVLLYRHAYTSLDQLVRNADQLVTAKKRIEGVHHGASVAHHDASRFTLDTICSIPFSFPQRSWVSKTHIPREALWVFKSFNMSANPTKTVCYVNVALFSCFLGGSMGVSSTSTRLPA